MQRLMQEEGLPYGERTMTYNSRLAQELACYAETQPAADRIHDRLFRAYFVDGINLAEPENLIPIGVDAGLAEDACREALTARSFREAVDADWHRSRVLGLTGVPAFVVGEQGVVGAQPYEVLEQLLEHVGARRESPER